MSRSSVASADKHDPRHIELLRLSSVGKEQPIRELLEGSEWYTEKDKDALRLALQKVAALGDEALARYLIQKGAAVDAKNEVKDAPGAGLEQATALRPPHSSSGPEEKANGQVGAVQKETVSNTKTNRRPKVQEVSALIRYVSR